MAANLDSNIDSGPISQINVTPFVDVVLVLLVIFMVTAPALIKDVIGLQLPKTVSADTKALATLGIAINRQGQILLNGQPISEDALSAEAARALQENHQAQAVISADQDARHGDVVKVIDLIKSAGIQKFAIQIERDQNR